MTITDTTPAPPGLRDMTDDELAAAWRHADVDDPAVFAAFLAAFDQRTAAERTARARQRREHAARQVQYEWYDAMHAQRSAFEAEGIGYLLNREGKRRGISEWALWTGPACLVEKYGSDEVKAFFARWPRLTLAEYKRQRRMAGRIQRDEWRDRHQISEGATSDEQDIHRVQRFGGSPELAGDETSPLRRDETPAEAPQVRPGRAVDRGGPGRPALGEPEAGGEERTADGRPGRPVQRDGLEGAGDMDVIRAARVIDRERQAARAAHDRRLARTESAAVAVPAAGTVAGRPDEQRIPGDQLLDLLRDAWLGFFSRFPSPAALDAVTLWAAHCWMRDENGVLVFRATPRLYLLSSEPGSGKSHVLELLMRIVPNCYSLDLEPTKAGLVHTLNKERATVLLDEGDLLFAAGQRKSDVRAVINGGTYRHGTVLNGKGAKANREPVFGAIALAGLDVMETATGDMLNALMSRGVKIRMEKATGEDRPPKLTRQAEDSAGKAKMWLERWAAQVRDEVADADPDVPEGVEGRAEDIWIPLLAVADAAGGDWPERARAACRELALGKPGGGEDLEDQFAEFAGSFGGL